MSDQAIRELEGLLWLRSPQERLGALWRWRERWLDVAQGEASVCWDLAALAKEPNFILEVTQEKLRRDIGRLCSDAAEVERCPDEGPGRDVKFRARLTVLRSVPLREGQLQ